MTPIIKLLILLIAVSLSAETVYRPLSKADRKAFQKTAMAFEAAYDAKNYTPINRFGTSVLETYSAIEMDPDSRYLLGTFLRVRAIVQKSAIQATIDSLSQQTKKAMAANNFLKCMETHQGLMAFLQSQSLDSLFQSNSISLSYCQTKLFDSDVTLSTIGKIAQFRFFDRDLWKKQSQRVEAESHQEFLAVSSSQNRDSLLRFQKMYPDLYPQDVQTLLEKCRQKHRLSVLRHPTKEDIVAFYQAYPEPDRELDSMMEDILYKAFMTTGKPQAAKEYLLNFPDGPRAALLRRNLQSLTDTMVVATHPNPGDPYLDAPAVAYPGSSNK